MTEEPLSDKERLLRATRRQLIDIMEKGRQCYDGDGNPIPDKFVQPSAADFGAALKLLHREEKVAPDENPFEGVDTATKEALESRRNGPDTDIPPDMVEEDEGPR